MEIMTCEQYVLARLLNAEAEAERLAGEVGRLRGPGRDHEEGAKPTRLQEYIYSLGRKAMLGKHGGVRDLRGRRTPTGSPCRSTSGARTTCAPTGCPNGSARRR